MNRYRSASSPAIVASIVAGPLFLMAWGIGAVSASNDPWVIDGAAWAIIAILAPVLLVGFVLAIVPVSIGTAAMTALGRWNVGMRHPAPWAIVGGFFGAWIGMAIGGAAFAQLLAATAAGCAMVACALTRWD